MTNQASMARSGSLTVGLMWHSANSPNLGVGALTVSNIETVEDVARKLGLSVRFKIFQWNDAEPEYVAAPNIEIIRLRARHLVFHPSFLSHISDCDVVLDISAGDSFADIYGFKRFALNALSKCCVLACRRPLILSPQTIGPFNQSISRYVAGVLLRSARAVVTRDNLSTQFVEQFGVGSTLTEATDVAFNLPFDRPREREDGPVRVGINVSGLLFNGGYTGQNMFGLKTDYPAMVRLLISKFLELGVCEVHLVSHVMPRNFPVEDDYLVADKLQKEFPELVIAPRFEHPSAAKTYIAGMDFFCGSRMHACIAAFSSGVPVMPIAYSRKFAGVFGAIGYSQIADCRTMTNEEVVDVTLNAFHRRDQLREQVLAGLDCAVGKLDAYQAVLKSVMRRTLNGLANA